MFSCTLLLFVHLLCEPFVDWKALNRYICKQWRPRSNAAIRDISSGTALFVKANLGLLRKKYIFVQSWPLTPQFIQSLLICIIFYEKNQLVLKGLIIILCCSSLCMWLLLNHYVVVNHLLLKECKNTHVSSFDPVVAKYGISSNECCRISYLTLSIAWLI